jgi:hypothetical protein
MRNRIFSLNFGKLVAICFFFYVAYCLLLHDNTLQMSVSALIVRSHQLSMYQHLLILGLIPIYIGVVIFGAAMLGILVGDVLQYQLFLPIKAKLLLALKMKQKADSTVE